MIIRENGEIEPCCDWVRETLISSDLRIDPFNATREVGRPVLRVRSIGGWHLILWLDFCPSCGVRTKIKHDDEVCSWCDLKNVDKEDR